MSLAAEALLVSQRQLAKRCLIYEWHLRGASPRASDRSSDGGHPDRE
jgi:hypothetical protein